MATEKQISYILMLAGVRFLSQVPGLTQRQRNGGMTKAEASQIIDELKTAKAR
jgi:hypothetical protein